jgi:hypothetical protein
MKHYLKFTSETTGAESFAFYNSKKNSLIRVDKWSVEADNNVDDIEWYIAYDLKNGYKFIEADEFYEAYNNFADKLNNIRE